MSEPFISEIRIVAFNFAPRNWALCDGQVLPINQNQNLYSLLGTTFGGDGRTTFALPDLRGRVPIHADDDFPRGLKDGRDTVSLSTDEIPMHTHTLQATDQATLNDEPIGAFLAQAGQTSYAAPPTDGNLIQPMDTDSVTFTGNGTAHDNMQPYLVLNFCIALRGIFPSRN